MDARLWPALESYRKIVGLCIGLKTSSQAYRDLMGGDMRVSTLANFLNALNNNQTQISALYNANVRDVAESLHDLVNEPNYNLATDLSALGTLVNSVKTQIIAVIPVSESGEAEERTLTITTVSYTQVASASLTNLITATDALIADIVVS